MVANPAGGVALSAVRVIFAVVLAALLAWGAYTVVHRVFFAGAEARQKVAQSNAEKATATGTANTATQAMGVQQDVQVLHERTNTITRETHDRLITIPGGQAQGSVDFDRAFDERIRMRDAYRGEPDGNTM